MEIQQVIALCVLGVSFFLVSLRIVHRTLIVLLGGALLALAGAFFPSSSTTVPFYSLVDWNVIFLILSMMILVGVLKKTGFSQFLAIRAGHWARGDARKLLCFLSALSLVFSALLGSLAAVAFLIPISILFSVELDVDPSSFIIAETVAANLGGLLTPIGDPISMMVASAWHIDFWDYFVRLAPFVVGLFIVSLALILAMTAKKLRVTNERKARILDFDEKKSLRDPTLLMKSGFVAVLVLAGFVLSPVLHLELSVVALFGATTLMLLTGKKEIDPFFGEVEWGTIFFLVGLSLLVGETAQTGFFKDAISFMTETFPMPADLLRGTLLWSSAVASGLLNNVPITTAFIPAVKELSTSTTFTSLALWIPLVLGAGIGGNLTLAASTASQSSRSLAEKSGYKLSFGTFFRIGLVVSVVELLSVSLVFWFLSISGNHF